MMSASDGGAVAFASADLLALPLELVVTSLLPEGAGAQAAARASKDTSASIFFMSNLLGFDLVPNASMPKTKERQAKSETLDAQSLAKIIERSLLRRCLLRR